MADRITIHAAKTRFSELVRRAEAGEEIVIARGDKPVARLVPFAAPPKVLRQPGRLKGQIALDDAFWEPLTDEELELWGLK
jgi:prevent-host-death family protein